MIETAEEFAARILKATGGNAAWSASIASDLRERDAAIRAECSESREVVDDESRAAWLRQRRIDETARAVFAARSLPFEQMPTGLQMAGVFERFVERLGDSAHAAYRWADALESARQRRIDAEPKPG